MDKASNHQKLTAAGSNVGSLLAVEPEHFRRLATRKNNRLQELDAMIIGDSPVICDLKSLIMRAADSDSTVLITGESGTGKELIAKSIHNLSPRRNEPFSAINCGALTESLLESELFGHVKGAFTGAHTYKKGLFEAAGKGTIFLDEFGEMSSSMQVRLLRVLQERRVRPVGSEESKEAEIHARVVVATNRNLKRDIAEGRFRQDLYYRVNMFPIRSPALRNHLEDLPVLIDQILKKLNANSRLGASLRFDTAAVRVLSDYSWPGNVRELENVIERLVNIAMETGVISAADVKIDLNNNGWTEPDRESHEIILAKGLRCLTDNRLSVRQLSQRQELNLYLLQLAQVGGDVSKAARRLGIKRTTLHMRIKRLEVKLAREF